jgi:putative heme-binding domain-containing protein
MSALVFLLTAIATNPLKAQVAAWTDHTLSVHDGLTIWLDASSASLNREAPGTLKQSSGDAVPSWTDGAHPTRSLDQPDEKSRPKLIRVGDAWVMRFDGEDDNFRLTGTGMSLQAATIFLVAAPHANPGNFRGLFAANAPERRDYESGLTIDLGPGPTFRFEQLNVEGRGFGGANDLLESASDFGTLHTLEASFDPAAKLVRLIFDGKLHGTRPFTPTELSFEELTVGARFYTNGPGAQEVRGPFQGDIAELLAYNRVLSESETKTVREYLNRKYASLVEELPRELKLSASGGVPLVKADNPPAVQMLLPGFSVREIPVELTNINNVRYRADGKLVTLGYNGDIHLLSDTNGDGIEDKAELFWKNEGSLRGPLGMLLTPPGYSKGNGVFVPSKGKVSLIVDTNGDDRADEEIIVATGWKEIPQNVDAVGIAMDRDGSLYFGLGTVNYANAYLVNESGVAEYDLNSDRGTVQKVSPDFSKRETVCTGIRFPIAFAFNREGDLFCTEQEGATWLPNGNPLDELLHIRLDGIGPNDQPGLKRHYGFPPRHPRHNSGVIDEPSTYDYGPQHQSTCGMVFNESVNGGPVFGPDAWTGDAIVCGESRGKLWRTKLMKTPAGYVATSQLLACLQMLTVDACVAPNGDLVVACHSGPPDWGTGPTGIGKLFRIRMDQPEAARPVAAWAEGPQEIRIAFDRPLPATELRQLAERIRIEYGQHVRAADRFETLMPPYAVVQAQLLKPRFELPVSGAAVTSDLRTLIVNTAPMSSNGHYAVTLPTISSTAKAAKDDSPDALPQHPAIDVDLALQGIEAVWKPAEGNTTPAWSGWLPHPDLTISKAMLVNSAGHDGLWTALEQPGTLILKSKLNLHNILRPAVQPGARIDYEWPAEEAIVTFSSNREIVVQASRAGAADQPATELTVVCDQSNIERQQATFRTSADLIDPVDVVVAILTGKSTVPQLTVSVQTNEDSSPRPMALHRFLLPWVNASSDSASPALPANIAELEGGSWARGRKVFRSEAAGCFKCHSVGGGGAKIGPDLKNMVHRDYASVVRDVTNPSFAINPDYIGHVVALSDGRILTGVLQSEGDHLLLGDEKGIITKLVASDIESMVASKTSVMPGGIVQKLTEQQMKDLLTYLMTPPPHMPLESPLTAPPLRTQAEVTAALAGSPETPEATRLLNIVLVDGPKDHGPGEHDYPAWKSAWEELLSAADNVTVSKASEFPSDEQLASADVLLFFQKGSFSDPRPAKMDAFLSRGGGAVYIHWAVNGDDQVREFSQRIGYASWGGRIAFRHGPLTLDIHNTDHPIVRNFDQLQLYDESYWKLTGKAEDVTLLATSNEDNMPTPQMWTAEKDAGRVFVSIPGHYSWTFDDPLFRILLLRGVAWTAKEPVDRFNDLVPIGARIQ